MIVSVTYKYDTLVQSNIAASLKRSIIYKWNDMNTHQEPRIVHGCGTQQVITKFLIETAIYLMV